MVNLTYMVDESGIWEYIHNDPQTPQTLKAKRWFI